MQKIFRCVMALAFLAVAAAPAVAGELSLSISNGRVTLIAHDVPVRQILAEWARVGQTRIVNGEKLVGPPVTIELRDVPEAQALESVLRSASGYVLAPRLAGTAGASTYDRIMILATSRAPAVAAGSGTVPQRFNRPAQPPPMQMPPEDDDDGEPKDQGPMPPNVQPGNMPNALAPGQPMPAQPMPGQNATGQGEQPVLTSPRPGILPQPPTVPGQGPVPGTVRKPGGGETR